MYYDQILVKIHNTCTCIILTNICYNIYINTYGYISIHILILKFWLYHLHPVYFEDTDPAVIERYFAKFNEQFFRFCDLELKKINIFFSGLYQRLNTCRVGSFKLHTYATRFVRNQSFKNVDFCGFCIDYSCLYIGVAVDFSQLLLNQTGLVC